MLSTPVRYRFRTAISFQVQKRPTRCESAFGWCSDCSKKPLDKSRHKSIPMCPMGRSGYSYLVFFILQMKCHTLKIGSLKASAG